MKKLFSALLLPVLLAGCGVSPAPSGAIPATRSLGAKSARAVQLTVPRDVLKHVDAAVAAADEDVKDEWVKDMYGRPTHRRYRAELAGNGLGDRRSVKVVVSRDNFKTTLEELSWGAYRVTGGDMRVPFKAAPGRVRYYLEVHLERVEVATQKRSKLPVRYISDFGKNYAGELTLRN